MKFLVHLGAVAASGRPPHGGRGLKSEGAAPAGLPQESPPARGAWIEISCRVSYVDPAGVAPRTGGVD